MEANTEAMHAAIEGKQLRAFRVHAWHQKLTSGRWLMTVAAAIVFAVMAIRGQLPAGDVKAIILVIITFYFTRNRTSE